MVEVTPNLDSTVVHIEKDTGKPTKDFFNWMRDIVRVITGFGDIVTHDASEFLTTAPPGDFFKIATVTANNTSPQMAITAGIDATYQAYQLLFNKIRHATDNQTILLQVSVNAGASWLTGGYLSSGFYTASNTASAIVTSAAGVMIMPVPGSNVAANGGLSGSALLHNPSDTAGNKWIEFRSHAMNQPNSASVNLSGGGAWIGTTAINGVRLLSSSGNLAAGTMTMYGLR